MWKASGVVDPVRVRTHDPCRSRISGRKQQTNGMEVLTTMNIISWLILGAIAGYLAGFLVKGDEGLGVIGHIVLGIVGALVGGFLASVLFNSKPIDGPFDISSIVVATIGAIVVVLVAGLVTRGTRSSSV